MSTFSLITEKLLILEFLRTKYLKGSLEVIYSQTNPDLISILQMYKFQKNFSLGT